MARNEHRLRDNRRIGYAYTTLGRFPPAVREAITARAEALKTEFGAVRRSLESTSEDVPETASPPT